MRNCDIYKLFISTCAFYVKPKRNKRISPEYMVCFLDGDRLRVNVEGAVVVNSRIRGARLYNKELKPRKIVL